MECSPIIPEWEYIDDVGLLRFVDLDCVLLVDEMRQV